MYKLLVFIYKTLIDITSNDQNENYKMNIPKKSFDTLDDDMTVVKLVAGTCWLRPGSSQTPDSERRGVRATAQLQQFPPLPPVAAALGDNYSLPATGYLPPATCHQLPAYVILSELLPSATTTLGVLTIWSTYINCVFKSIDWERISSFIPSP